MVRFNEEYGALSVRICPECELAFYARVDGSLICPHCRYAFIERRGARRSCREADITILFKGRKVRAKLKDYSARGARVVFRGVAGGMDTDSEVEIDICELRIRRKARAVWLREVEGSCVSAGFTLL